MILASDYQPGVHTPGRAAACFISSLHKIFLCILTSCLSSFHLNVTSIISDFLIIRLLIFNAAEDDEFC